MSNVGRGYRYGQVLAWDYTSNAYMWMPTANPTTGQVLSWNGSGIAWTTPTVGGTASGDLAGTYPSPTVDGLQGRAISATAPTTGQVYRYSGTQWEARGPLYNIATGAVVTADSGKLPVGVVGTVTGHVLTWNGTTWAAAAAAGGGGATMSVVLGDGIAADQLVFLDEPRNSALSGPRAFKCCQGVDLYGSIDLETGATWASSLTQPYCYDACALAQDLVIAAYRYNGSLRIRAVSIPYYGAGYAVGTAVDLSPDGGSNDVAYVSIAKVITIPGTHKAAVIAWVNPTTSTGWLVVVSVVGTTITAGTPISFRLTGCLGTAVSVLVSASATAATGLIAWADVATNTGLSQMFNISGLGTTNVVSMRASTGAPYTFTALPAASIGQPTLRAGTSTGPCSIMYGVSERRVRKGYTNPGNAGPTGTEDINWKGASTETRVDAYDVYGSAPGYVLDAAQYGTGDFFDLEGNGALLVTGTKTGFENYLHQIVVRSDPAEESVTDLGTFSHQSRVIMGGLPSGPMAGASLTHITLRVLSGTSCLVAAVSDNAGGAATYVFGWGYLVGGNLQVTLQQPINTGVLVPLLGVQPQHATVLFPITKAAYGRLTSYTYSGTNYLRLYLGFLGDPRVNFTGVLQTAGSQGATRTISLPGNEHTFTTSLGSTLSPGQHVYVKPESAGFVTPGCLYRTSWRIGMATATNKALIERP